MLFFSHVLFSSEKVLEGQCVPSELSAEHLNERPQDIFFDKLMTISQELARIESVLNRIADELKEIGKQLKIIGEKLADLQKKLEGVSDYMGLFEESNYKVPTHQTDCLDRSQGVLSKHHVCSDVMGIVCSFLPQAERLKVRFVDKLFRAGVDAAAHQGYGATIYIKEMKWNPLHTTRERLFRYSNVHIIEIDPFYRCVKGCSGCAYDGIRPHSLERGVLASRLMTDNSCRLSSFLNLPQDSGAWRQQCSKVSINPYGRLCLYLCHLYYKDDKGLEKYGEKLSQENLYAVKPNLTKKKEWKSHMQQVILQDTEFVQATAYNNEQPLMSLNIRKDLYVSSEPSVFIMERFIHPDGEEQALDFVTSMHLDGLLTYVIPQHVRNIAFKRIQLSCKQSDFETLAGGMVDSIMHSCANSINFESCSIDFEWYIKWIIYGLDIERFQKIKFNGNLYSHMYMYSEPKRKFYKQQWEMPIRLPATLASSFKQNA